MFSLSSEQILWGTSLAMAALFLPTLVIFAFDRRTIERESIWAKPLKFEASLAIHFATLAFAVMTLDHGLRWGPLIWWTAIGAAVSAAFEVGYILVRAARRQASHFNRSTPFYASMYVLMAAGAVIITAAAGVVGLSVFGGSSQIGEALRLGLGIGLVGGTILTLLTAFPIGAALSRYVGHPRPHSPRMPLTGWSMSVGDRRVPHFFGTHMMQAVPLAALFADFSLPEPTSLVAVWAVSIAWIGLTLMLLRQATLGRPLQDWSFIRPGYIRE